MVVVLQVVVVLEEAVVLVEVVEIVVDVVVVDVVVVEVVVGVGYVNRSPAAVTIVMARKCVSAATPVTVVVAVTVDDGALTTSPVATHDMLVFPARSHPTVASLRKSQYENRIYPTYPTRGSYPWPGMLMVNLAVLGPSISVYG